jgi:acetyltransferase-like isoleucine patch superfamily enzyme
MSLLDWRRLSKGLANPRRAWPFVRSRAKGMLVRTRYLGRRGISLGRGLRVTKGLSIWGPGQVTFGDDLCVDGTMHTVTLPTYSPDAQISIGSGSFLNGTRFGCAKRITVGRNCILGDCRIMDTNFHSVYPERRNDPSAVRVAPASIGDHCWIGAGVFILPGTTIREGSTVAAGAVVMGRFPARSVLAGNPAEVIMTLPPGESSTDDKGVGAAGGSTGAALATPRREA